MSFHDHMGTKKTEESLFFYSIWNYSNLSDCHTKLLFKYVHILCIFEFFFNMHIWQVQQYYTTLALAMAKLSITLLQFGGIERIYCINRKLFDQSFIYMWILVRDVQPNFKKKNIPEFLFSAMIIHDGWKIIYI